MRANLYSFAHLGGIDCGLFRLRGVGLANCLFPWARCVAASRKYGLKRIASTWPQLCHRQWMRWDPDKRCYAGLFDERGHAAAGARKWLALSCMPRIAERDFLRDPSGTESCVVVFSGMDGFFSDILGEHEYVRALLVLSTRARHVPDTCATVADSIAVHIRLGDFLSPDQTLAGTRSNVRQPLAWYTQMVRQVRSALGSELPVSVFSDGRDDELRSILDLTNTRRVFFGSSIADLHAMSTANVLIASASTFSLWAAYLGQMPVIWPPGQRIQSLHGQRWEYEPEVGFGPLPEESISLVRRRMNTAERVVVERA